jgi:SAM-dependent methyltransferase
VRGRKKIVRASLFVDDNSDRFRRLTCFGWFMVFRFLCWMFWPFARLLSPLCHRLPAPPFRGIDRANGRASRFLRETIGEGARFLVVGGTRGTDEEYFLPHFRPLIIDFCRVPGIHLQADLHWLPLRNGVLDGAMVQGVIDNVESPPAAVRELFRTIRPGGALYTNDAFLQAEHPQPVDLQRFSQGGWRHLLRDFEIREMGASVGPFGAIYLLVLHVINRMISNPHTRYVTWFFWGHLFRWLLWVDGRNVRHAWANYGAAAIYSLCIRPEKKG